MRTGGFGAVSVTEFVPVEILGSERLDHPRRHHLRRHGYGRAYGSSLKALRNAHRQLHQRMTFVKSWRACGLARRLELRSRFRIECPAVLPSGAGL